MWADYTGDELWLFCWSAVSMPAFSHMVVDCMAAFEDCRHDLVAWMCVAFLGMTWVNLSRIIKAEVKKGLQTAWMLYFVEFRHY